MPATRLVLIRHGESVATVERVVGGHRGCKGLSERGRDQAVALRERLLRTGELREAAALYASQMPRALETADLIAPAVGSGALLPVQECGVCEWHPADEADGITWDEWELRYGEAFDHGPFADLYDETGESWAQFQVRAGAALARIAREHDGEMAVVACHGGVVEASLFALAHLPLRRHFAVDVENTSITEWELVEGRHGPQWKLRRLNDAAHLT